MRFLVDAQLLRRFVAWLQQVRHEAVHTLELPAANRTSDSEINRLSIVEQRIVITKDSDFVDSFVLARESWKLLLISTGNITNREIELLIKSNLASIVAGFETARFIELTRKSIVIHN